MKNLYFTLIVSILFIGCNSQNKENKIMTKDSQAPYNIFKEGEMEINFDELMENRISKIESALTPFKYEYPSEKLFKQKVQEYFNLNVDDYSNNIVVLQNSMMPEIAIKNLKLIYVDYDSIVPINGELLYNYNNYLIHGKKSSFDWLKDRQLFLLKDIVINYGYTKDDELLKLVFSKTDFSNKIDVRDLIFDSRKLKYSLREEMLSKIRTIKYDNEKISSFSEVIDEDFYYTLLPIIDEIQSNKKLYNNPEKSIAILLNEVAKSGITGGIDSFLNKNNNVVEYLEKRNYYEQKKLQEYITILYERKNVIEHGAINDSDGYTNLRKEPNTNSEILEKINTGEKVEILSKKDSWYLVKTSAGKTGYVYNSKILID